VLPAAALLKKQGANNGATTAFLISTPESGVDSMAITYALLDPIMTVARPCAAFAAAAAAGIAENLFGKKAMATEPMQTDMTCSVDGCCDGNDCPPDEHKNHHSFYEKVSAGIKYALNELWNDIAAWFLAGLLLAGMITTLIPTGILTRHLGGGISSMFIILAVGIPLYICATASTPIAAALIISGVSPGAALVFLLTGPATNVTSLTMLLKVLGKRATVIYLLSIAVAAVAFGIILDGIYHSLGISAQAIAGQASEIIPEWARLAGAIILLGLSVQPVCTIIRSWFPKGKAIGPAQPGSATTGSNLPMADNAIGGCGCSSPT